MAVLSSDPSEAAWEVVGMIAVALFSLLGLGYLIKRFIIDKIPGLMEAILPFFSKLFEYSSIGLFSFGFIEFLISQKWDGIIPNIFALLALVINNWWYLWAELITTASPFGVFKQIIGVAYATGRESLGKPAAAAAAAHATAVAAAAAVGAAPPAAPVVGPVVPFGEHFCKVPGFGALGVNGKGPGSIVLVTTIMFHYLITIWWNGGGIQSITPSLTILTLWIVHSITVVNNCAGIFYFGEIAIGILIGCLFGFMSAATTKYGLNKGGSPGSGTAGSLLGTPKGGGLGSTGPTTTPGVGTCSAPNDQDQFVCEAYKNGDLITTTIVE